MRLLFALHLLNFIPWWVVALRNWRTGLPFLLASGILFQFTWVSPAWLWANGIHGIAGIEYATGWTEALAAYIVGVGLFNFTWLVSRQSNHLPSPQVERGLGLDVGKLSGNAICLACLTLALLSYQLSGMPATAILNPFNDDHRLNLYGMVVKHPVLEGFADSLIPASALALVAGGIPGVALFLVSAWVMLLSGFRFRLIVLALSLFVFFLMKIRPALRPWLVGATAIGAVAGLALLTVNRSLIVGRHWRHLGAYSQSLTPALLVNETNNCQTFMACLASPFRQELVPDGGLSLYWITVVRAIPARFFPNGRKPEAHTMLLFRKTYDQTRTGRITHPALSCLEEWYLSAGMPGLILCMAGLGALCAWLGRFLTQTQTTLGLYSAALSTGLIFQIVTRGYMPQTVELVGYLSLPLLALYLYDRYARRQHPDLDPDNRPQPD